MKESTRRKISELIQEELAEKVRTHEGLRRELEALAELPVEDVANSILENFLSLLNTTLRGGLQSLVRESISHERIAQAIFQRLEVVLTSDELRDGFIKMVREEIEGHTSSEEAEQVVAKSPAHSKIAEVLPRKERTQPVESGAIPKPLVGSKPEAPTPPMPERQILPQRLEIADAQPASFATEIGVDPAAWYLLYGFVRSAGAEQDFSTGLLSRIGVGGGALLSFNGEGLGLIVSKLSSGAVHVDLENRGVFHQDIVQSCIYEYEQTLNELRKELLIATIPVGTIIRGPDLMKSAITRGGQRYRAALDAIEKARVWVVDVLALDSHLSSMPFVATVGKTRETSREPRIRSTAKGDARITEKVLLREKALAQEVFEKLLRASEDGTLVRIVSADSALKDDWKPILQARLNLASNGRQLFCSTLSDLQRTYEDYRLVFRVNHPTIEFSST